MAPLGGIAAKTTSVLLTKHLRTVPCLRHQTPHHCGDLDPFRTIGQTSVDFSNSVIWSQQIFSFQSPKQKRLSIYNWNPGPRRGKEDAFEKQIAGRWHVITLQEASEYVEHEILRERFHVTHFAGCAILFNKDTFYPDISVKSCYLHDTRRGLQHQVVEGEQGLDLQGVLSRASFRRAAASGQKAFTVLSLHRSASLFFHFLSPARGMELLLFISWDAR